MSTILLDCDPGIDDAVAILLALASPEFEIGCITTVCGNKPVELTTRNARRTVDLIEESSPPISKGMASPLVRDLPADPFSHGEDGLGNTGRPEPQTPIDERHATDTLFEEAKTNDGEVTLITLGPLSNPALTLLKYPEWADKITRHVMIGGLFGVTPHAFERPTGKNPVSEWNVYVDPEAADRVIDAPFETVAVGLDVTTSPEMRFRDRHVSTLEAAESPVADFVLELITFVRERGFTTYTTLIDPLAVALAVDEGLAETRRIRTTVETDSSITRGQTVPDLRKNPLYETDDFSEVDVVTDVNYEGFLSLLVDRLVEA